MQLVQEHPNRYDVFEVLIRSACRLGEARIAAEYARRFPLDNPYVSPAKQRAVASNTVTYCRDLHHIDIVIPGIEPSPRR